MVTIQLKRKSSSGRILLLWLSLCAVSVGLANFEPASILAQDAETPAEEAKPSDGDDAAPAAGEEGAEDESGQPADDGTADNSLAGQQNRVADKYRRLEDLIFKMSDFEATSNPRRSSLLKQAYKQSKDRLTQAQLNSVVKLLNEQQYKRAIDGQDTVHKDLQDLLRLLMSEDRSDRLKNETERIREYIKELKRLERIQRGVRGRTEGASDPRDLSKDQEKVADRTGELAKQLEEADAKAAQEAQADENAESQTPPQPNDSQNGQGNPSDGTPQDSDENPKPDQTPAQEDPQSPESPEKKSEPDQKQPDESPSQQSPPKTPAEGQTPRGDQQPQEETPSGDPSQSQQQQQQPSQGEGTPQEGQQEQNPQSAQTETPAKKRVREAEQKMREAQQKLEEAKRSESVEKQTEALEKLQEAIAELEEVLRQLREEEVERVLALLEGRFRKMLEMEMKVYEGTLRIDKIPEDKRSRAIDIRSGKLAFDQRKIAAEADRCLTLLLEEGSSVAFPEVVEQLRDDMEEVSARLDQTKVDRITQGLEEEIIGTLEELIAALQKAQQDMEEGQQNQPPSEPGEPSEPPLVDILAELKMIRSLQQRVNARTSRYSQLLDDPDDPVGRAQQDDLRVAIGKLSELESRIQRITRDIVLGKNK